jgi:hypothetical protein
MSCSEEKKQQVIALGRLGWSLRRRLRGDPMPEARVVIQTRRAKKRRSYGAVALPCRVQDPDRKGRVESGVGHAERHR